MTTEIFDPVMVEVLNNELGAITEEMALVIWKAGRSPMIKTGDFATAVCDARGRMVGLGFAAPFQLAALQELMQHLLVKHSDTLLAGDVLISNDPYSGMTHMPDIAVVVPMFWNGRLAAFCLAYSHHSDVGGRFPGGFSSQSASSFEEGIRLPIVKIRDAGIENRALVDIISANVRVPIELIADIEAKVAGCLRGEEGMRAMFERFGLDTFEAACDYLIVHAERAMRSAISEVPDGTYIQEDELADDGVSADGIIKLRLSLSIRNDELTADFTGSSSQVGGALNVPITMTRAAVYGAVKSIVGADVSANAGFFRPIKVIAPAGSVLNPQYPAAVGGRAPVFYRIFDLVFRALALAMPDRVPVSAEGGDVVHFTGVDKAGRSFAVLDVYFGGWGARVHKDGIDGVTPVYMGSYGTMPVEILEREFPVVVESFSFVPDSGGPGRYRGSVSVERRWRFLDDGEVMVRTIRLAAGPGLGGGLAGYASGTVLNPGPGEVTLPTKTHVHLHVQAGDRISHTTGGSGGYGPPLERDPALVLQDVIAGKVTANHAAAVYGIEIGPDGRSLEVVTNKRRNGKARAGKARTSFAKRGSRLAT